MASASAGVGSALPSQVGVTSGWALTTDGTSAAWASVGGGSGVTTMAAVGSSPSANGASISSVTLTLQPADATHPGVVTAATQTMGGDKTLSGGVGVQGTALATYTPLTATVGLFYSTFAGAGYSVGSTGDYIVMTDGTDTRLQVPSGNLDIYTAGFAQRRLRLTSSSADFTGLGTSGSLKLQSPNGTTFTLTVSNAGALVIT
jgi:hypothetical protein